MNANMPYNAPKAISVEIVPENWLSFRFQIQKKKRVLLVSIEKRKCKINIIIINPTNMTCMVDESQLGWSLLARFHSRTFFFFK